MVKEALYFNNYGIKDRQYGSSSHFPLMASAVTVIVMAVMAVIVVAIVAIMVAVVTVVMVAIVTVVASVVTASVSTGELFGGFWRAKAGQF